jgi:hypothetical protein
LDRDQPAKQYTNGNRDEPSYSDANSNLVDAA